jgi:hypothetical protein
MPFLPQKCFELRSVPQFFLLLFSLWDSHLSLLKNLGAPHMTKFCELHSANVYNLVASFKCHLRGGYIDSILELKSKICYDYIQKCYFPK